jgi:hypothetical protein
MDGEELHDEGEDCEDDAECLEEGEADSALSKKQRKGKSTRWNIPKAALQTLEEVFKSDKFPSVETRKKLANNDLHVTPRQVQVWFQNKRQRSGKPSSRADVPQGGERKFLSTSVRAATPPFRQRRLAGMHNSRSRMRSALAGQRFRWRNAVECGEGPYCAWGPVLCMKCAFRG